MCGVVADTLNILHQLPYITNYCFMEARFNNNSYLSVAIVKFELVIPSLCMVNRAPRVVNFLNLLILPSF